MLWAAVGMVAKFPVTAAPKHLAPR